MRPVLVGQAITHETEAGRQLAPLDYNKTGSRICRLMGISDDQYYRYFHRVNVWHEPKRGQLDPTKTRLSVLNIMGVLEGRQVILLGQGVASCFGLGDADYTYCTWYAGLQDQRIYRLGKPLPFDWAVIPHPSGLNRWYNSIDNAEMAGQFLHECVGHVEPPSKNGVYNRNET